VINARTGYFFGPLGTVDQALRKQFSIRPARRDKKTKGRQGEVNESGFVIPERVAQNLQRCILAHAGCIEQDGDLLAQPINDVLDEIGIGAAGEHVRWLMLHPPRPSA
jgi:hypothetical protein